MSKKTGRQAVGTGFALAARSRKTLEMMVEVALEQFPTTCSGSDLGVGRKIFFSIPLKMKAAELSDFVWVYAESKLSDEPQDAAIGFTEDDVIEAAGICVFKKVRERFIGESFALDTLLSAITDLSLRNRIIYRVAEMKASIRLDDEFIERANMEQDSPIPYFH